MGFEMGDRVTLKWLQESRMPHMFDVAKAAGVNMTGWSIGRHFGKYITLVDRDMHRYGTWKTADEAERGTDAIIKAWEAVAAARELGPDVITVSGYRVLNASTNGNPRFVLFTDRGEIMTSSDAACNYMIRNGWTVNHVTKRYRDARVKLTRAGRIAELEWLDGNN